MQGTTETNEQNTTSRRNFIGGISLFGMGSIFGHIINNSDNDETPNNDDTVAIENAVKDYYENIVNVDLYKIGTIEQNGDSATVEVVIRYTMHDMQDADTKTATLSRLGSEWEMTEPASPDPNF